VGETGTLFVYTASVPPSPPTPPTLLDWLAARYPAAKRQTLRRMLQDRRVTVNGRPAIAANRPVCAGDTVEVRDRSEKPRRVERREPSHGPVPLHIVHEDADVLVVDKPPGLLTSTVPREKRPTLLAMVRAHVESTTGGRGRPARVGLIHRLDRDASGLLVFSKTHDAYLSLKRQFFEHSVERVYAALVEGVPTPHSGRVQSRLVERADGTVYSTRRPGEGRRAVTDYEVTDWRKGRSLVRVTLRTGRKHQIRVHMSGRGAPVAGDTMYGGNNRAPARRQKAPPAGRLMLAATKLSFTHPRTGERTTFELPVPDAFISALGDAVAASR